MEERHIRQLVQNLIERFEYFGEDRFDFNRELEELSHPITRTELDQEAITIIESEFLEHIQYRRSHDGAILIPVSVVSDPREHEEWYPEWYAEHDDAQGSYYWKRLEDYLSRELTRKYGPESAGSVVHAIDDATYSIMEKMANPNRESFAIKEWLWGMCRAEKPQILQRLLPRPRMPATSLLLYWPEFTMCCAGKRR